MPIQEISSTPVDIECARARAEYNGTLNYVVGAKRPWQIAALIEGVAVLFCIWGLIYLGSLPKQVPYIIATDRQSHTSNIVLPKQMDKADWNEVALEAMKRFVINWRTVTSDQRAQFELYQHAFWYVGKRSPAYEVLAAWYRGHDPIQRSARGETTVIHFTTNDRSGDNTIGLWFEETTFTPDGSSVKKTYRSRMTYAAGVPASNEEQKEENHFGFAITELETEDVH